MRVTKINQTTIYVDPEASHIDLKEASLTAENAKILAVACQKLTTITADGKTYDWTQLKPWLTPRIMPKNFDDYWSSAKNLHVKQ
jgi:hypothetical protein